jgi:hypothetical protein
VDASQSDAVSPQKVATANAGGRIAIAVVASKDGTLGFDVTSTTPDTDWKNSYSNGAKLVAISKLQHFDNAHLSTATTSSNPDYVPNPTTGGLHRQTVSTNTTASYQVGNSKCVAFTPFDWPLGSALGSGKYSFTKVINFDPQGVARIRQNVSTPDTIVQYMEIGLLPAHGSVYVPTPSATNPGNVAAIQVNGMTGSTRIYRP